MADTEVKTTSAAAASGTAKLSRKEKKFKQIAKQRTRRITYRKAKKAREVAKKAEDKKKGVKPKKLLQNYMLPSGVMRYGDKKKGVAKSKDLPKVGKKKQQRMFVKKIIGGEKNGGTRLVRLKKLPNYYTLNHAQQPKSRGFRVKDVRKLPTLRKSLKPGTVCILLTGKHRGKHVIFLKQLGVTGLLLVTGPYFVNGVPLRRISQKFVIATKTRVDISTVKIPENVKDHLFRHQKKKAPKVKAESGIFETKKKQKYVPSEARKKAQVEVDRQLVKAIKTRADKKCMLGYLKSKFALSHGTYPHRLVF